MASAVTMKSVWTGTVFSSTNGSGAFGRAAGASLDGLPAQFVFLYDPDRAGSHRLTSSGSYYDEADGFFISGAHDVSQGGFAGQANRGAVSPILSATATINGVSRSITPHAGYVGVERSLNSLANSAFGSGGSIRAFGEDVFVTPCGEDDAYSCRTDLVPIDQAASFARTALNGLSGNFEFTGPQAITGLISFESVVITRESPAPAPVPVPAGLALLASGMLGLGALARRPRRRRDPEAAA